MTIPGPVLLMGGVDHDWSPAGQAYRSLKYKRATADPRYPQYFPADHPGAYASADGGFPHLQGSFCKVLQIEPGTTVKQDITVEPASTIPIKIQDATGRPLANTFVWEEGRDCMASTIRCARKPIHGWPRAWPSQANRGAWSSTNPARSCSPRSRSRATRKGLWSCGCSPVALFGEPSSTGPASL